MKQPTDEQIDAWESEYGDSLRVIPAREVEDDFEVVVRPLSGAEFRAFVNEGTKTGQSRNASVMAMSKAALWPPRADLNRAAAVLPGLAKRVCDELQRMAGSRDETWRALDATMSDDELTELGIPAETASALRAQYPHPGQLQICTVADLGLVLVCKRPTVACTSKFADAMHEAYFDASSDMAVDCVVWPAPERFAAMMREHPAIASLVLVPKLTQMAKGEGESAAKKLTRRGRA